jgi:translation initiation factor IF-2
MDDKVRVYEVAEEAGASSNEVISKAVEIGINLKSPQSTLSFDQAEELVNYMVTGKSKKAKSQPAKKPAKKDTAKTEIKIEEKKVDPVKEVIKQAEAKKEEKVKEEEKTKTHAPKPVSPKKNLAEGEAPLRRRKLTIVKKKRPQKETPQDQIKPMGSESQPKKAMKSMSELFGNAEKEATFDASKSKIAPKPKKTVKKVPARAHEYGKKIELEAKSDFVSRDVEDSIIGEEVVLYDMDLLETSKFLQEAPKKKNDTGIRTTKPSAFGNVPRGLKRGKKKKKYKKAVEEVEITSVTIPEECRVYEFAEKIGKTAGDVIGKLFMLGMMVTKNDFLGNDEIEILGEEYGVEITIKDELEEVNYEESYDEDVIDESNFSERPPVVTIMGHVDHGKTSLLDKIRSSRVAAGEAGGITQHISAYTVEKNGQEITFVDTPGHEAFKAMRVRGASITDIIIIVVAADDGVMPQTVESIKAAKESGCPIIVAVNKIDKESANMDMVKAGMAEREMTPVDWGGDIEFIGVSALTGAGIEDLLENILIQSELLELKADPEALCKATVLEGSTVKGRGPVASVIVQNGTLRVGDNIVADTTFGRVKALLDDNGKSVKELGLSRTGQVVGLGEVPTTGVSLVAQETAAKAKEIAKTRAEHARAKELSKSTKVSLEEMSDLIAEGKINALPVIIKADAGGSLEAIKGSLEAIRNDEVKVNIISSGVGGITEADVAMASASNECIIVGFNVRPTGSVKTKAKADGVDIKTYSVIYALIDDIKDTLSGMMSKVVIEENTGQAEVRDTFVVPKVGTVAGCMVSDGKVVRGGMARLIRDGVVVYTGKIDSLKRFKDDVKEVANGYECGIMFKNFNDIKVGDYIETFIEHSESQTID